MNQLNKKLIKQNEDLLSETNPNSPLFIQKKQLQKDIDDFNILNKQQDARAIQQIIERIEHMSMFNKKYQPQSIVTPINRQSILSSSSSCSYRVSLKVF